MRGDESIEDRAYGLAGQVGAVRPAPAVCITGMHRSGTSMVTRLLHEAGLWLGPPASLMPAAPDHPEGFFEHLELVRLADEALECLGGAWDTPPPPLDSDRAGGTLLQPLSGRAEELLAELAAGAPSGVPWGWKDPRASLLLPFWRLRRPDLRSVVCLRHPLAVARSLRQRHQLSVRFGLRLWRAYNEVLLAQVRAGAALATHYEAWLSDPEAELRRVADYVGLAVDARRLAAAIGTVQPSPRRAGTETADALLAASDAATVQIYDALRACAGPVYARCAEDLVEPMPTLAALPTEPAADDELQLLRARVRTLDAELRKLRPRGAPYRLGTPIDASRGGNAPLYLEAGWAEAQDNGTWSIGNRAVLVLLPIGLPPDSAAIVHARVRPMVGAGHERIDVHLQVAGTTQASWRLDRPRPADLECRVEAACITAQAPLRLVFRIDSPCAPSAIGRSADPRLLGFLLQSLTLRPAAPG